MYKPIYDQPQKKSCLQVYISWTSYINLLISLVALGFGIYQAIKNRDVWTETNYDWNKVLVGGLLVGAVFLFLTSISGIIGGRKQNKCCIFFFQFFSLILAVSFLVIGFVFLGITDAHYTDIKDADCKGGSKGTEIFTYGQQAYDQANGLLCTQQCPCNVSNENVKNYIKTELPLRYPFINENGVKKVQNCATYNDVFNNSDIKNQAGWLRSLEESFDCTGMCDKPNNVNLYFFSDINNGLPVSDTCKVKFQDFVSTYGKVIYIVGLIVGFYLLINSILSCCLCCKRQNTGQSYYERFANF